MKPRSPSAHGTCRKTPTGRSPAAFYRYALRLATTCLLCLSAYADSASADLTATHTHSTSQLAAQPAEAARPLELTEKERAWISENPSVRLGIHPALPPFVSTDTHGRQNGLSIDYINRIRSLTGLDIEVVPGLAWPEVISGLKEGSIDMAAAIPFNESRAEYLDYTRPYFTCPATLLTREGAHAYTEGLGDYNGHRVGTGRGSLYEDYIRKSHPDIELVVYNTPAQGVASLLAGTIDAYAGNQATLSYLATHNNHHQFTTGGAIQALGDIKLCMASRKGLPELASILDKALAAIVESEKSGIQQRWTHSSVMTGAHTHTPEHTHVGTREKGSQTLVILGVTIIAGLILLTILFMHLLAKGARNPLNYDINNPRMRRNVTLFNALLLVLIFSVSSIILGSIKRGTQQDIQYTLAAVLDVTLNSLHQWADTRIRSATYMATNPEFIAFAQERLRAQGTGKPIPPRLATPDGAGPAVRSPGLDRLRQIHQGYAGATNSLGFFIIAPDGTSIASMRDTNLGNPNPIKRHRPELLDRVFRGESVLVPPIPSDVPLDGAAPIAVMGLPPTMFVAVPIRGENGEIIAAATLRFEPNEDFSHLTKLGRIGTSGETYTIDREARLLTASRFNSNLVESGLIPEGSQSILSISVRDPGRDLTKTGPLFTHQGDLPLTRMASSAVRGHSGSDMAGYRDYRGVEVVGAWTWDERLNIGITTEIDKAEAFASYNKTRMLMAGTLVIISLLAGSFAIFNIYMGTKATAILKASNEKLEERVLISTRELRQSETHYRTLVNNIPGTVYRCAVDERWTTLYVSDNVETITGYPASDFLNNNVRSFPDIYYTEDADRIETAAREALAGGRPYIIEYRIWHRDGTVRWIYEKGKAVYAEDGEISHVDGFMMDVTERKKADQELQKLSSAIEQSPVSVVITDKYGRIEYVNPTFVQTTGYTLEESIGRNLRILKSGTHSTAFFKDLWQTILSGKTWKGDIHNKKKNGALLWERTSIAPITNEDGEITYFVEVKEDITERKKIESDLLKAKRAAESANKAKSTFLANMSHEIRTPMNAILGFAQLLSRDATVAASHKAHVETILSSGRHLLDLINDILDMSKIEAGRSVYEPSTIHLTAILEETSEMFRVYGEGKGLSVSVNYDETLPHFILCDERKLRQVIINLMGNAIKFTRSGSVSLSVSALEHKDELKSCDVTFMVEDTGQGIPEEDIRSIFTPFERSRNARTNPDGTGLGLAISRGFVKLMGGNLKVESREGKGSRFFFTIPTRQFEGTDSDAFASMDHEAVTLLPDNLGTHILLVDDNESNRILLKHFLEEIGFAITLATNGKEAIDACHKVMPDLILMDLRMPVMDGFEATGIIKNDPELKHIPVIAVTASVMKEDRDNILSHGMDDLIHKPFQLNEVLGILKQRLSLDYVYRAGHNKDQTNQAGRLALTREGLSGIPETDRNDLLQLIMEGNVDGFEYVLQALDKNDPAITEAIRHKLNAFAYDELIELLS